MEGKVLLIPFGWKGPELHALELNSGSGEYTEPCSSENQRVVPENFLNTDPNYQKLRVIGRIHVMKTQIIKRAYVYDDRVEAEEGERVDLDQESWTSYKMLPSVVKQNGAAQLLSTLTPRSRTA